MASKTRKLHYPPNWKEMSLQCKQRARFCCEWCGIAQGTERTSRQGKPYKVVLTVHHPHGNTLDPDALIVALCQVCHLRDDAPMHAKHARETRGKMERESALNAGQLPLLEVN
jgi:hypothetical protein